MIKAVCDLRIFESWLWKSHCNQTVPLILISLVLNLPETGVLQDSWNQILVYFAGTAELSRYQVHYVHAASKALSATNSEDPLPVWEVYTATALKCLTNIVLKKGKSSQEDVISILLGQVQDLLKVTGMYSQ